MSRGELAELTRRDVRAYHADLGEPIERSQQSPAAQSYKADCKKPKDREEADLCEQRRMAIAAEELVARTDWQIRLTYWEIVGLLATVLFTAIAAWAAAHAARSANKAVAVSQDTARRHLRAYIGIVGHKLDPKGTAKPIIHLTIRNGGVTPARNVNARLNTQWYDGGGRDLPADFAFQDLGNMKPEAQLFLGGGEETIFSFPLDRERLDAAKDGRISLYMYGVFNYMDMFDQPQKSTFCYKAGPSITKPGEGAIFAYHRYNDCT